MREPLAAKRIAGSGWCPRAMGQPPGRAGILRLGETCRTVRVRGLCGCSPGLWVTAGLRENHLAVQKGVGHERTVGPCSPRAMPHPSDDGELSRCAENCRTTRKSSGGTEVPMLWGNSWPRGDRHAVHKAVRPWGCEVPSGYAGAPRAFGP